MSPVEFRPIGSFFPSPDDDLLGRKKEPPWAGSKNLSYVQTGRQALALIADYFAAEGRNQLLSPDYLCESMLLGFEPANWNLETYRINYDMTVDTENLVDKVTDPSRTVVLSATYFGNEPSYQHVEALKDLQKRGVRVIEDETHRVLGDLAPIGDVALASLRKTLPVADGAYIRGSLKLESHNTLPHSGWRAMDEKLAGNHQKARVLFAETDKHLKESIARPSSPDRRTMETISTLKYEVLRERRRSNSAWLRERLLELPEVDIVNTAEVPSHLVVRVEGAQQVQKELSQEGIYCPIHWPRPERLKNIKWRDDLLSLPIDHRYDINDMQRIAEQFQIIVER